MQVLACDIRDWTFDVVDDPPKEDNGSWRQGNKSEESEGGHHDDKHIAVSVRESKSFVCKVWKFG